MKSKLHHITLAALAALLAASVAVASPQKSENKPAQSPTKEKKSATRAPVRTLDAVRIEGEIAVPQVLFITSRDYRRYRDGLGATLRMSKLDVARSIDLPTRLRIVASPGHHKEAGQ